jgi:hypothetical protein
MTTITLDYTIPCSVRVDIDSGQVEAIFLCGGEFQFSSEARPQPERVFTCNALVDGETLPEYIEREHPVAQRAIEIANQIQLSVSELLLPFQIEGEAEQLSPPTYGSVLGEDTAQDFVRQEEIRDRRWDKASLSQQRQREDEELTELCERPIGPGRAARPSSLAERVS